MIPNFRYMVQCSKLYKEAMAEGVNYCGPVKTSHKGFLISSLENCIKDLPGGSYLVMKSTPKFPGDIPLISIGDKYNSSKVLVFIATEGAGSAEPGNPYLSHFPDIYSNISVQHFFHPCLLGRYFNACNAIYNHNSMSQSDLVS